MNGNRRDPTLSLVAFDPDAKKLTDIEKLAAIHERLAKALVSRTRRCRLHAAELVADMELVGHRLERHGHNADIGSVRVAAYHIAQTELEVLKRVMAMVDSILLGSKHDVDPEEEPHDG